ncbi:carbon-nitrogen hydrolase family protein [Desulfatiferula olefinivorans]
MKNLRVALSVFSASLGQTRANLDRMAEQIAEAASSGASLICFPELALTGYCSDERILSLALDADDDALASLQDMADKTPITILAGLAERDPAGRVYASHFVFIPDKPLGKYRKLHLAPPEKAVFTAGDQIPVFDLPGFRFGIQLCYDAHFPFLSTRMAEMGADAIFIPHASPRGSSEDKFLSWMRHIPARSYDNGVFTLVCNQCGAPDGGLVFPGLAFAVDPSGLVMARDLTGEAGLLYADLTDAAMEHVRRHRMRYFLPNQRHDLT